MTKKIESCRSGRDFISYAERAAHERNIPIEISGGGRHMKVKVVDGGSVPIPNHPGDLPTGTRFSIIKMLRNLGLAVFFGYIILHGIGVI